MIFTVSVEVLGIEGIADPAGQTIERALPALGFTGVQGVRLGKLLRFTLEATDKDAALATVGQMCDRLLANPVIERTRIAVEPLEGRLAPEHGP